MNRTNAIPGLHPVEEKGAITKPAWVLPGSGEVGSLREPCRTRAEFPVACTSESGITMKPDVRLSGLAFTSGVSCNSLASVPESLVD